MNDLEYLIWSQEAASFWRPDGDGFTAAVEEAGRFSADKARQVVADATDGGGRITDPWTDPVTGTEYRQTPVLRLLSPESEKRLLARVADLEDQLREQQYLRRMAEQRADRMENDMVTAVLGPDLVDELAAQAAAVRLRGPDVWANVDAAGQLEHVRTVDGWYRVVGVGAGAPSVTFLPEEPAITTAGVAPQSLPALMLGNAVEALRTEGEDALWAVLEQVYRQVVGDPEVPAGP